ncbi:MAG TPA: ATP-binding cassette domain-containing protein [Acidimicrobiales bacterium]|nr:ATP-binding cassette domain-containing protein [Acidimicrobiales bacterium]
MRATAEAAVGSVLERARRGGPAAWAAGAVLVVVVGALAGALLPDGLPFGVVLLGLVLGGLSSLTAMGLVIVYRSARIINFAQAEIGGLSAAVAVVMVTGSHLPYFAALPVGLAVALLTGLLVDLSVMRRLFAAPRLIVTVATIGVAQILGALELVVPKLFSQLGPTTTFTTPFSFHFDVGPIVFNGNHVVAMVVIPVVLIALAWFFTRTDFGIAIRGAADSTERAQLLGIPVMRLSSLTWMLAAGLSGIGAMLSSPILGPQLGALAGPEGLLAPLAAAVIGRMESLTTAFVASLVIGVFEQAVFWSYPRATTVDVALFLVVLLALLLQRRRLTRTDDAGLGSYVAQREIRPIPTLLRRLPEVRIGRGVVMAGIAAAVVLVPLAMSDSQRTLIAYMAIYGIIAVSLVVLTGWSGQISLGQFAFVGLGAGTTASLFVNAHVDLFFGLAASVLIGALAAVIVGVPALRVQGLFLAVVTLAFAVPANDFFLDSTYFPWFTPNQLSRPALLERFDLNSAGTFYYFCLFVLAAVVLVAWNYRRSRPGRAALSVRDNARGAASFGISPNRTRLVAFAFSGALAGLAGGLYVIGLRGIGFGGYPAETSLQVFTMVVIGGLGSLTGGLVGAVYVQGVTYFLSGAAQLLATGAGILLVVLILPGGLAAVLYWFRDRGLRLIAARRGLSVPSLAERAAFAEEDPPPAPSTDGVGATNESVRGQAARHVSAGPSAGPGADPDGAVLVMRDVDAAYGQVQVLFGVDLDVRRGEVLGLLGTNGSGKSTSLKVASGLLGARRGRVVFEGEDVTGLDPVARVKRGLAMVPSGRGVFPSLTVAENLRLGGWLARREPDFLAATTARILGLFPALEMRMGTLAGSLSGGEQQMLTIAQALYSRPKLLMIDELSLGLAPTVVSELLGVVRELAASGVTVVVVEQSLNLAVSITDRAVFMERGQVRFSGRTAELAERPDLVRSVFLGGPGADSARGTARGRRAGAGPDGRRPAGLDGRRPAGTGGVLAREAPAGPDAPTVFAVLDVHRRFGGVAALDGVDLSARQGEILGIIGANGAGKTTLFDICSGFLPPSSGRIVLDGLDVTEMPAEERAALGLGRVFQDARLFPSLTVAETLAVAHERRLDVRDPFLSLLRTDAVRRSEAATAASVDELVGRLGLDRYRDAFISELSTGTRRVVELGCLLAHQPQVVLLDEPTSGIAQRESEALGELLVDLRAQTGATFIIIEHDVPLVSSISDRLVCLHLGRVLSEGIPAAVLADPLVVEAYLGVDPAAVGRSGLTAASKRAARRRSGTAAKDARSRAGAPAAGRTGRQPKAAVTDKAVAKQGVKK